MLLPCTRPWLTASLTRYPHAFAKSGRNELFHEAHVNIGLDCPEAPTTSLSPTMARAAQADKHSQKAVKYSVALTIWLALGERQLNATDDVAALNRSCLETLIPELRELICREPMEAITKLHSPGSCVLSRLSPVLVFTVPHVDSTGPLPPSCPSCGRATTSHGSHCPTNSDTSYFTATGS